MCWLETWSLEICVFIGEKKWPAEKSYDSRVQVI